MKRLLFIFPLLWCSVLAGQIRVSVFDSVTKEPVPYAHMMFGDHQGWYSNEEGIAVLPEDVKNIEVSHISYESKIVDISQQEEPVIYLTPVATMLSPAIVQPAGSQKKRIGHAADKRISLQGGRNGSFIAELFRISEDEYSFPLITCVLLNLNTVNLKKNMTVTNSDTTYYDGILHVAKLRVDLRCIDQSTGGPGESLISGGVIYSIKDKLSLSIHKIHKIELPQPILFPAEGVFVVVEWIVTNEVREQDMVSPSIWRTQSDDSGTSWRKWPLGTPWKQLNSENAAAPSKAYCIGLELLE